ncbi:MAG: S8 family serine peptidase [Fibrobacter sp.]|nr:S8 family serine peptidase [Fibrobacter sp.]
MMKKVFFLICILIGVLLAENSKRAVLAPYEPFRGVSQAVSDFFSDPQNKYEKLHVEISYTDLDEKLEEEIILDNRPVDGVKKILLNGRKISESEHENYLKNLPRKPYRAPGFDSIMTYSEIQELLLRGDPVYIDAFRPMMPSTYPAYDSLLFVSKITTNAFANSYNGSGVGVYFNETGCPSLADVNMSYYSQGYGICPNGMRGHPTGVVRILQTTAPLAHIYGYDQFGYPNPDTVSPAINVGSHSWSVNESGVYGSPEMEMDNYIYEYRVTNFVAAGNHRPNELTYNVSSPGVAVNAITVGAINPRNNSYESYSRWINSNIGNQKPEIANYTNFYFPGDSTFSIDSSNYYNGEFNGTSASTPYSAGMAANLMSQYPDMKRHPEVVKAYMLVQNGRSIYGAYNHDQDNNTEAALTIPYYNDQPDVTHYTYWNGNNNCCFSGDGSIELTETGILSGHRYRIAIAWLVPGCYVLNHGYLSQDIDIDVYQGNTLVAYSISGTNPFEMVDFTTQSSQDLRIVIKRFSNSGYGKVALGYAMWHN